MGHPGGLGLLIPYSFTLENIWEKIQKTRVSSEPRASSAPLEGLGPAKRSLALCAANGRFEPKAVITDNVHTQSDLGASVATLKRRNSFGVGGKLETLRFGMRPIGTRGVAPWHSLIPLCTTFVLIAVEQKSVLRAS